MQVCVRRVSSQQTQCNVNSMPKHFSDDQYGQAVFGSVQSGAYPESEELVSAELPSSALPGIIKLIENAREDVKVQISI